MFFPSFHSSAGQLLFLFMWCVGAPAMCSLDNNICHSRTSLQACRDPLESEVSGWDVCWVSGCPGTLCPGPRDVAAVLHVLWRGLVACRRGFWRSGLMARHTTLPLPWRGVLQQLWVQAEAQSPQPAAPLRIWIPAALPTMCLTSSWITSWLFSWLLDRRTNYTFLFFTRIVFRVITCWWYYLLFSIFIIKYMSVPKNIYVCVYVCIIHVV